MTSKFSHSQSHSFSKQKPFLICFLIVFIPFLLFVYSAKNKRVAVITSTVQVEKKTKPAWFDVIANGIKNKEEIKVGLVNIDEIVDGNVYEQLDTLHPQVETVPIDFERVDENLKWKEFFPEWIDEKEKWDKPTCPKIPMPALEDYEGLNVVVAKVPCGKEGIRDVFGLQVNLVVANLAVENGWVTEMDGDHRIVYVVFIGSCGPMVEIFRCDDLLMHQGAYWVYKPDLRSLKQKTLMPVGTCQISRGYAESGKEAWRRHIGKLAYVTILHSSEAYVCGAIALAQSILQTKNKIYHTRDLILLADKSIGPESIKGLKAAGWKIKIIQRISNPFAKNGAYNQWNYSKLRIWQLTMYDRIIFIDSDLLVLKSIDYFFFYPQLSAAPNEKTLFNSGLMIVEPSQCMFENMMQKTSEVKPYNGGDQGFLNQIFTWWHRLPSKLNYLKSFETRGGNNEKHEVPEDVYTIHYLGLKPWMCYRDYDCNWDMKDHHVFASDSAHERWWQLYDTMPKELQSYCGLTEKMNKRIVKWRRIARNASLSDGHWKIEIKDPRKEAII